MSADIHQLPATGKFLPTRRTPGISTSDLLERIVRGYRTGMFDAKLEKVSYFSIHSVKSSGVGLRGCPPGFLTIYLKVCD